jgi:hypothetical protein
VQAGDRRRPAPGKVCGMPIEITFCRLCSRSRPAFLAAVRQLAAEHPNDLIIVELECMAACDDVPAVMIETDYYPQVTPNELIARVHAQIGKRVPS